MRIPAGAGAKMQVHNGRAVVFYDAQLRRRFECEKEIGESIAPWYSSDWRAMCFANRELTTYRQHVQSQQKRPLCSHKTVGPHDTRLPLQDIYKFSVRSLARFPFATHLLQPVLPAQPSNTVLQQEELEPFECANLPICMDRLRWRPSMIARLGWRCARHFCPWLRARDALALATRNVDHRVFVRVLVRAHQGRQDASTLGLQALQACEAPHAGPHDLRWKE